MSTTDTSLEQRIALLEDRAAISELLARFCLLADKRDWAALTELYTEDGVFDVMGPVKGREAILETVSHLPEAWDHWFHFVSNEIIEISGDSATAVSYFNAPFVAGGVSHNALGRYDDTLERVDGVWQFSARVLSFGVNAPLSEGWSAKLPDGLRAAN
jgi:ketosteroid isomerase-like protein